MTLDAWLTDADLTRLHLRDLSGSRPIPAWRELTWDHGGCDYCSSTRYAPADEQEWVYEGDSVVCADCGLVSSASIDSESASIQDAHGLLTHAALAGFRRALGIPLHHWRTP